MKNITELKKDNIRTYQEVLPPDIAENIGRAGYCGIAREQSVLVFRQSRAKEKGTILFYASEDAGTGSELFSEYETRLIHAGIARSELELPLDLGNAERESLQKNGYLLGTGESRQLHTTISRLSSLPFVAGGELSQMVRSTGTLSVRQFRQGLVSQNRTAALEDALTLPLTWFDHSLSCCVQEEGRVCGYLLIHRMPSGALRPELFYVTEPAGTRELLDMIRYVIHRAQEKSGGNTPVLISRSSTAIRALTDKLLPGLHGNPVLTAVKELSEKEV